MAAVSPPCFAVVFVSRGVVSPNFVQAGTFTADYVALKIQKCERKKEKKKKKNARGRATFKNVETSIQSL